MALTPEQKQTVSSWVANGDNLSTIQRKLADELKVNLTFMDVRFLVDDLNLQLKDPVKPVAKAGDPLGQGPAATPQAPQEKRGFLDKVKEKVGLGAKPGDKPLEDDDLPPEEDAYPPEEALPPGASSVSVSVDKLVLHPGAMASGTVTFSDGVTAKWLIDQYGRPGFTEVSQPGYRPTPGDAQAFMQELQRAVQQQGY